MGALDAARLLSARQNGALTFEQLCRAGLSRRRVQGLVERGELTRLHRSVYRFGPVTLPYCPETAAVLACGPKAVVSHRSASYLYGMLPRAEGPVHVTVTGGGHRQGDEGTVVHETS